MEPALFKFACEEVGLDAHRESYTFLKPYELLWLRSVIIEDQNIIDRFRFKSIMNMNSMDKDTMLSLRNAGLGAMYDIFVCMSHAHNKDTGRNTSILADKHGRLWEVGERADGISVEKCLKNDDFLTLDIVCVRAYIYPWESHITFDGVIEVVSPIISPIAYNVVCSVRAIHGEGISSGKGYDHDQGELEIQIYSTADALINRGDNVDNVSLYEMEMREAKETDLANELRFAKWIEKLEYSPEKNAR